MIGWRWVLRGVVVALGSFGGAGLAGAQSLPAAAISNVELSADTVALGDVFEVQFTVRFPAARTLFLPDSLAASSSYAPYGPVTWASEPESAGQIALQVRYSLLALELGPVTISGFDLYTAPSDAPTTDAPQPVGVWDARTPSDAAISGSEPLSVPAQRVWVTSVLPPDDVTQGLEPRPSADVWGGDWHWPSLVLAAGSGLIVILAIALGTQSLLTQTRVTGGDVPPPSRSPRAIALDALDQLLARDLHRSGSIEEFYLRTSDIVRRYIETLDRSWGTSHTSTELLRALDARLTELPTDHLQNEMRSAESVKFGLLRPAETRAEDHWRLLRSWIEQDGPAVP
jgi:hypothetical protein